MIWLRPIERLIPGTVLVLNLASCVIGWARLIYVRIYTWYTNSLLQQFLHHYYSFLGSLVTRDDVVGCRSSRFFRSGDGACTLHHLGGLPLHSPPLRTLPTSWWPRVRDTPAPKNGSSLCFMTLWNVSRLFHDAMYGPQMVWPRFDEQEFTLIIGKRRYDVLGCRSRQFLFPQTTGRVHYAQ